MSGLYFKYGTMNSSKSANLLMVKHNYDEQGFRSLLLKPGADTREGRPVVKSRVGIEAECIMVEESESLLNRDFEIEYDVILVDECQFLTESQVEDLYKLSKNMPVLCFGLLTDFMRTLFPGSKRLIELSDSIQEIKSICACGRRAVVNGRFKGGVLQTSGAQVEIGAEDKYRALCRKCYDKMIAELKLLR